MDAEKERLSPAMAEKSKNNVTNNNNESSKSRPQLSFGISRILSDFGEKSESVDSDLESNDDTCPKGEGESEKQSGHCPPFPTQLLPGALSAPPVGYCGYSGQLSIHRPHPIIPMLTSYGISGWLDMRRDRFGGEWRKLIFSLIRFIY